MWLALYLSLFCQAAWPLFLFFVNGCWLFEWNDKGNECQGANRKKKKVKLSALIRLNGKIKYCIYDQVSPSNPVNPYRNEVRNAVNVLVSEESHSCCPITTLQRSVQHQMTYSEQEDWEESLLLNLRAPIPSRG